MTDDRDALRGIDAILVGGVETTKLGARARQLEERYARHRDLRVDTTFAQADLRFVRLGVERDLGILADRLAHRRELGIREAGPVLRAVGKVVVRPQSSQLAR